MKIALMWILSLLFIILGLGGALIAISGDGMIITTICFLLLGLYLLPPINELIKIPKPMKFIIVFGLLILSTVGADEEDNKPEKSKDSKKITKVKKDNNSIQAKRDALWNCHVFVKRALKSPATAEFAPFRESKVSYDGSDEYTIISYVDSQNGFGALLRSKFKIRIKNLENGKIKPLRLIINEKVIY